MQDASIFDPLPLPVFYLMTLLLTLLFTEAGYRCGRYRRRQTEAEREETVGGMVASSLGMVAFLLAFTFGIAASRFEDKRGTLHEEVNAIGTAYLRADLLPEPQRSESKKLLKEYADARLLAAEPGQFQAGKQESERLQTELWNAATKAAQGPPSVYVSLYLQTLNELIDLHTKRLIAGLHSRIPDVIWFVLLLATFLAFSASGYHAGIVGTKRSPLAILVAILFTIVIGLIMDLERTQKGSLRINMAPMRELKESLR